jgi:hypothetical protein
MKKFIWSILVIILLLGGPATAQFYRYTDKNGNLRFTDDIDKVPAEQRANIREYQQSGKGSAPATGENPTEAAKTQAAGVEPDKNQPNTEQITRTGGTVSIEALRVRIERMIVQVDAEYETITKAKEALSKRRDSMKSREELAAYNKAIDEFNQRAENYEKMSSQLHKLIDEYNALVSEEKPN